MSERNAIVKEIKDLQLLLNDALVQMNMASEKASQLLDRVDFLLARQSYQDQVLHPKVSVERQPMENLQRGLSSVHVNLLKEQVYNNLEKIIRDDDQPLRKVSKANAILSELRQGDLTLRDLLRGENGLFMWENFGMGLELADQKYG